MMKTRYLACCALALASLTLSGCTTHTHTATTTAPKKDSNLKKVYTREDLNRTGESDTGEALEKVDPAVRRSGPR
jgi:hypothetical protein